MSDTTDDQQPGNRYHSAETIESARVAWVGGEPVGATVKRLKLPNRRILYRWRDQYGWDNQRAPESALVATTRRYNALIDADAKTPTDWEEILKLADLILRFEKMDAVRNGENVGAGRTPGVKNGEGKQRKRKKNDVSHLTAEDFERFENGKAANGDPNIYPHQQIWLDAGENPETRRTRFILKSRQIGATFTFAYEAFKSAVLTGENQIFLSATKDQAKVFKSYMSIIARNYFEVEISGDPIKLSSDAELFFLSPNAFADSRGGNYYCDEAFKIQKFTSFNNRAEAMATLAHFKKTFFSSPTAISHAAHSKWDGKDYTKFHPEIDEFDVHVPKNGDCELTKGRRDADGYWRNAITIHDAVRMGWNKVRIDQLRQEMPDPELFAVTYECQFIDDSNGVFRLEDILACGVNIHDVWTDVDMDAHHPIGLRPCAGGYDPAAVGDNASCVVMTFPQNEKEKFRLLKKSVWHGISAPAQVNFIREDAQRFNFHHFEIDATGPGLFIPSFLKDAIPHLTEVQYNPIRVALMIQKGQSIILGKRFEYDENDQTLPLAFLTIYMQGTENGVMKYASRRAAGVGHGDEAWACLHAFMCEPINPSQSINSSFTAHE